MKRGLTVSLAVASVGALFIGVGVFQICAGYAFAKHGSRILRSDQPYVYWFAVGAWVVIGVGVIVRATKIYRRGGEDSEAGQDK